MRATVVKRVSFAAAHFLPNYSGKCKNLHGHTWSIELGVSGIVDKESGFVIDFSELKEGLQPILDSFDHHLLNDIIANPTAENIARFIFDKIVYFLRGRGLKVKFVRVWETEDSYAEVLG